MLQRVVRLVGSAVGPVAVVAAPGQEIPRLPDSVTVVRDAVAGRGPLQGLAAGLAALPSSAELVYASATDVPFLQPSWIERLVALIGDDDLAIPYSEGRHHPLASLYRRAAVLPAIETLLRADRMRPVYLMEMVRTRVVAADELRVVDPELKTLRNLNTPEDYRAALRELFPGAGC
jgi:molybdopterin-guanine dinucleotide biosynthesis protein A